jgi:hypothetical protein
MKRAGHEIININDINMPTRECLPRRDNFVANSGSPSFEGREIAWEASTLPLSYTRARIVFYSQSGNM